tara:strand:- start:14 stop:520 length:507 start_codon:yes stop_codon:yes gene_type:complete
METWKEIEGFEGRYSVSNLGRVKSFARNPEIILKGRTTKYGYKEVGLCNKGDVKSILVHRLVATAFIEKSGDNIIVNHLDGNKQNNNVNNLEWCTYKENSAHAYKMQLKSHKVGTKSPHNKLSENTVIKVKEMIRDGFRNCEIIKELNLKYWYVSDIKLKKSWAWLKI